MGVKCYLFKHSAISYQSSAISHQRTAISATRTLREQLWVYGHAT
ncbi:hypothetical protein [Moorena sp. SIO3I6]|nr:hypothetical protein [Moorena sp. SIO3I6]